MAWTCVPSGAATVLIFACAAAACGSRAPDSVYLKASNPAVRGRSGRSSRCRPTARPSPSAPTARTARATGINGNQADNSAPRRRRGLRVHAQRHDLDAAGLLKASNTGAERLLRRSCAGARRRHARGRSATRGQQRDRHRRQPGRQRRDRRRRGLRVHAQRHDVDPAGLRQGVEHRRGRLLRRDASRSRRRHARGRRRTARTAPRPGSTATRPTTRRRAAGAVYVFTRIGDDVDAAGLRQGVQHRRERLLRRRRRAVGDGTRSRSAPTARTAPRPASTATRPTTPPSSAGAVYVFTRTGTTWTQQAYVKASNTGRGDRLRLRASRCRRTDDARGRRRPARTARRPASTATRPTTARRTPARSTCSRAQRHDVGAAGLRQGVQHRRRATSSATRWRSRGRHDARGGRRRRGQHGDRHRRQPGRQHRHRCRRGLRVHARRACGRNRPTSRRPTRAPLSTTCAGTTSPAPAWACPRFFGIGVALSWDASTLAAGASGDVSGATGVTNESDTSAGEGACCLRLLSLPDVRELFPAELRGMVASQLPDRTQTIASNGTRTRYTR